MDLCMKQSWTCPKCGSKDIVRVDGLGGAFGANGNVIRMGMMSSSAIPVTRYVCISCGFTEEWVDIPEDRERLRERYGIKE